MRRTPLVDTWELGAVGTVIGSARINRRVAQSKSSAEEDVITALDPGRCGICIDFTPQNVRRVAMLSA